MNNSLKYLAIGILFFVMNNIIIGQPGDIERQTFWLHGFDGDYSSWDTYPGIFMDERLIKRAETFSYDWNNGVPEAAESVRFNWCNGCYPALATNEWNIGIGHSQGGVVLRDFERQAFSDASVGGIITVGSPNHGAYIANSFLDGEVEDWTIDACDLLAEGPAYAIPFPINISVDGIGYDEFCRILYDKVVQPQLIDYNNQTTIDLANNSNYFQSTLEPHNPGVPIISIHGEERSPVHWRMASSYETDAQDEEKLVKVAKFMRGFYAVMEVTNIVQSVVTGIAGFFQPELFLVAAWKAKRAIDWGNGKKWFDDSEEQWHHLMGAKRWGTENYQLERITKSCDDQLNDLLLGVWEEGSGNPGDIFKPSDLIQQMEDLLNDPNCYETVTETRDVFVMEASDGLIPESSQLFNGRIDQYKAEGVNHREELNSSAGQTESGNDEMEVEFNKIWDRPLGDFFRTEERQ